MNLPCCTVRVGDTSLRIRFNSTFWLQNKKSTSSRAEQSGWRFYYFIYLALCLSEAFSLFSFFNPEHIFTGLSLIYCQSEAKC